MIETIVLQAAAKAVPGMQGLAAGSYRRGKSTSGDVDVILTHPDGQLKPLAPVLKELHRINFLTDDLAVPGAVERADHSQSYMGVCRLPRLSWGIARQLYIGWYLNFTPYQGGAGVTLAYTMDTLTASSTLFTSGGTSMLTATARSTTPARPASAGQGSLVETPDAAQSGSLAEAPAAGSVASSVSRVPFQRRRARAGATPCYLSWLPHKVLQRIVFFYCGGVHRRIDIKVYPKHQFAFAVSRALLSRPLVLVATARRQGPSLTGVRHLGMCAPCRS